MVEEGYVIPGSMVVASDSHSNMYGGLGALGTPIVRTDAAAIWATGQTWWQVPPVARVTLTGQLAAGATAKDIIITLCGLFNQDEALNHAVEFYGEGDALLLLCVWVCLCLSLSLLSLSLGVSRCKACIYSNPARSLLCLCGPR